jgi:hypothetical protein
MPPRLVRGLIQMPQSASDRRSAFRQSLRACLGSLSSALWVRNVGRDNAAAIRNTVG